MSTPFILAWNRQWLRPPFFLWVTRWSVGLLLVSAIAWAGDLPEPKRIYLANDHHTDYMWSMDEEGYRRAFLEMLDYYLAQIDATATNPSPYQARWNSDGSFWLWVYEKNKKPEEFRRLIERVRDGHISAPMTVVGAENPVAGNGW